MGIKKTNYNGYIKKFKRQANLFKKNELRLVKLLPEEELENEVAQSDEIDMNIRLGIQKFRNSNLEV